ncbi:MAG: hypothetical protein E7006_03870 [Alphaproteobacteria bacterium]|nr:hypothetical protein [Alphaproteobacteria bacterium]
MKKLTAGIFSVLMGLVAVNAADAAVASKGYVTGQIKTVTESINTVSQDLAGYKTDNDAAVALKADKTYVDTELGKKQNTLNVTGGVLTWDAETSTLGLTGIATSGSLETLQTTVNTLNGAATEGGSVKKQIADAIASEVARSNQYADTAETDAIAAAKTYTDGRETAITTAYQTADRGLQTQITANANNFENYTTTADMNTALGLKEDVANKLEEKPENWDTLSPEEQAKYYASVNYVDAEVSAVAGAAAGLSSTVSTLTSTVSSNKTAAETGINEAKAAAAAAQTTADAADALSKSNKTAIDNLNVTYVSEEEMTTFKGENTTAIANAKSGAEATAATYTDNSIAALALQSISRVPMECSEPTKYCALTTNGTNFVWEVIERDFDEETVPAGTPVTLATKDANPNK